MERIRKTETGQNSPAVSLIKCLLTAWIISGAAVLLLALVWYRFQVTESVVSIGILVIYALSCFAAGLLMGKCAQTRRFLWGLVIGTMYFAVLVGLTACVNHGFKDFGTHFFTTWMICAGSGMLGGMIS